MRFTAALCTIVLGTGLFFGCEEREEPMTPQAPPPEQPTPQQPQEQPTPQQPQEQPTPQRPQELTPPTTQPGVGEQLQGAGQRLQQGAERTGEQIRQGARETGQQIEEGARQTGQQLDNATQGQ